MQTLAPDRLALACPASPLIMAVRAARTPLAIATGPSHDATILFANAAFAEFVAADAQALGGRTMASLSSTTWPSTYPQRLSVARGHASVEAVLSTAPVAGADGIPFCVLCSLMEANGNAADLGRDADLLAQVAQAAGALLQEAGVAAAIAPAAAEARDAGAIAAEAMAHVMHTPPPDVG